MINEELENYTEDGSSTLNNGESYGSDLGYEDDEDFVRYRKDMIFQNIDFTKHKTKIGCTIGYVTTNPSSLFIYFIRSRSRTLIIY